MLLLLCVCFFFHSSYRSFRLSDITEATHKVENRETSWRAELNVERIVECIFQRFSNSNNSTINKREWHWAVFKGCFFFHLCVFACDTYQMYMQTFRRFALLRLIRHRIYLIFALMKSLCYNESLNVYTQNPNSRCHNREIRARWWHIDFSTVYQNHLCENQTYRRKKINVFEEQKIEGNKNRKMNRIFRFVMKRRVLLIYHRSSLSTSLCDCHHINERKIVYKAIEFILCSWFERLISVVREIFMWKNVKREWERKKEGERELESLFISSHLERSRLPFPGDTFSVRKYIIWEENYGKRYVRCLSSCSDAHPHALIRLTAFIHTCIFCILSAWCRCWMCC